MTILRQRMLEDLRIRNYSPSTVECYIREVTEFAKHFGKSPEHLGPEEIRSWQLYLLNEKRVGLSSYIQAVCSLRFFYQNTLNRKIEIERIPLPRYEKKLPVILSKEEVKAVLEAPKNLGHRAILATLYGTGLRVSEVINLKVCDLDRDRKVIWVRNGKGHKDRQVMFAEPLRDVLVAYWRWKRPVEWLFPGEKPGSHLARETVFETCRKAGRLAGIAKSVHPHSLRHYTASQTMPLKLSEDLFAGFWLFVRGIVRLHRLTLWMNDQEGFHFSKDDRTASPGAFEQVSRYLLGDPV